ncbi:MAG: hypothetical protein DWQ10_00705 [Calditrichaeota bacterium]|nr:MAG: hypothetical protein DWQ10_00705 [Calditrichota bacterium]
MSDINRRDFLKLSGKLAAAMGIASTFTPKIAEALNELASGQAPVVWLQGLSCSGCSVSFLNADAPSAVDVLTEYVSLIFHSTLMTATGEQSLAVIDKAIEMEDYLLVVEGAVPAAMPEACLMGHEKFGDLLIRTSKAAKAVVSIGTCASFGGIPAAENNLTGAMGVADFLEQNDVSKPQINLPGCPSHPDWFIGTLVHVLKFGIPKLDEKNRPLMFYSKTIHDQCPRFPDYERERFAKTFSDSGCFFELGCLGVHTYADCTLRGWNSGINNCIKAGMPCVGCASDKFTAKASFPLYTKRNLEHKKAE